MQIDPLLQKFWGRTLDFQAFLPKTNATHAVFRYYGRKAEEESTILSRLNVAPGKYILATVHRAENTDEPARLI